MNKKRTLWILLDLVFLIVFNLVFFVLGGKNHPASVWISYVFIHFAYTMLLITPFLIRKSTKTAVLGFPLYVISSAYFVVTFLVGVTFILIRSESYKVVLIINIIIFGIYAVILISNMIANESTADSVERNEVELRYVRDACSKLTGIMALISDKQLYKGVEKCYDLLHSSQVKSDNSVEIIEKEVLELINDLEEVIKNKDREKAETVIKQIEIKATERNTKLKNLK